MIGWQKASPEIQCAKKVKQSYHFICFFSYLSIPHLVVPLRLGRQSSCFGTCRGLETIEVKLSMCHLNDDEPPAHKKWPPTEAMQTI